MVTKESPQYSTVTEEEEEEEEERKRNSLLTETPFNLPGPLDPTLSSSPSSQGVSPWAQLDNDSALGPKPHNHIQKREE